jgi:hypothetical protein
MLSAIVSESCHLRVAACPFSDVILSEAGAIDRRNSIGFSAPLNHLEEAMAASMAPKRVSTEPGAELLDNALSVRTEHHFFTAPRAR